MKKLFIFTLFIISHASLADGIGFSIGAYNWQTDVSGGITSADNNFLDLSIDSFRTEKENNTVYFATLIHPIPILPNLKLTYNQLENTGRNGIYKYGSETYVIGEGTVDLTHTDVTAFYNVLNVPMFDIDAGLTLRMFDGELGLRQIYNINTPGTSASVSPTPLDSILALIYARAEMSLPFGLALEAETNFGQLGDESGIDVTLLAKYRSPIGLGVAAGYRSFNSELEAKSASSNSLIGDLKAELDYEGPMFYVFYSF